LKPEGHAIGMKPLQEHEHMISYPKLFAVLCALLILTAITITVSRLDLGFPFWNDNLILLQYRTYNRIAWKVNVF